ncbi:MAG: hypothetical protein EG826_19070, partial [Deltaproteobacteria bacterium]|nr:hypothetical protein [Deltaproteobacteria bacterium]
MIRRLLFIGVMLCTAAWAAGSAAARDIQPVRETLGRYRIEIRESSVSGLSAGGFFANQFFVAYSDIMSGVGVFAGGLYGCARGDLLKAVNDCMSSPGRITPDVISDLVSRARADAQQGRIDPLENLKTKKVFLFSGSLDRTVRPGVVDRAYDEYLKMGVPSANLRYERDMATGHAHFQIFIVRPVHN